MLSLAAPDWVLRKLRPKERVPPPQTRRQASISVEAGNDRKSPTERLICRTQHGSEQHLPAYYERTKDDGSPALQLKGPAAQNSEQHLAAILNVAERAESAAQQLRGLTAEEREQQAAAIAQAGLVLAITRSLTQMPVLTGLSLRVAIGCSMPSVGMQSLLCLVEFPVAEHFSLPLVSLSPKILAGSTARRRSPLKSRPSLCTRSRISPRTSL